MSDNVPESAAVLAQLASCFMDANPASLRALKLLFDGMDARTQQVYVTNLKRLLTEYPLFNQRLSEKSYAQVMVALNELLKESCYKARKGE